MVCLQLARICSDASSLYWALEQLGRSNPFQSEYPKHAIYPLGWTILSAGVPSGNYEGRGKLRISFEWEHVYELCEARHAQKFEIIIHRRRHQPDDHKPVQPLASMGQVALKIDGTEQ